MDKRAKRWTFSCGDYGLRITVYERHPASNLYIRIPTSQGYLRRSLGHRDRKRARARALEVAAKLALGVEAIEGGRARVRDVFAAYERYRHPNANARRSLAMWARFLGASRDVAKIDLGQWDDFIRRRTSGQVDASGAYVEPEDRSPVRVITVVQDLKTLRMVLRWASRWRVEGGSYLLRENPVRGYPMPKAAKPRRSVATLTRYEALRGVAGKLQMRAQWTGQAEMQATYLPELLDIVVGTGRRISAILQLRYENLRLNEGPYGSIRWPGDTDKMDQEWDAPVNPTVRAALDRVLRERPGIGRAFLFPSPTDLSKPLCRGTADLWLARAEALAGLEPLEHGRWHPYRRMWATERKHLPAQDVAAAGGWSSIDTMQQCYQHADAETMLEVVCFDSRQAHG